ncbi:hypothetical protein, partial [Chitiniphilus shinanonensis]|uniref:hypothetical protein n=1 Tax=Chitiniphilus shinanonensis TaxID=553088 RepID=UPI00333FDC65
MPSCLAPLRAALCVVALLPAILHAAPVDTGGGTVPITAIDYFSEDHSAARRGSEQRLVEDVDPFTGGLRINIPLFSLPGAGGPLAVQWAYNSLEPFAEPIRPPRVRDGRGSVQNPIAPTLELPDGSTQRFYKIDSTPSGYPMTGVFRTTGNWWLQSNGLGQAMTLKSPDGTTYQLSVIKLQQRRTLSAATSTYPFGSVPARPDSTYYTGLGGEFDYYLPASASDANGNRVDYGYDGTLLTSLTAADGRAIRIAWSNTGQQATRLPQVTSVTAGSRSWSFAYSGDTQLTMTQPDGLSWQLGYRNWETYMTGIPPYGTQFPLFTSITYPTGGQTRLDYARYLAPNDIPDGCNQPGCRDEIAKYVREQPRPVVMRKTTSDGGVWTYQFYAGKGVDGIYVAYSFPTGADQAQIKSGTRVVTTPVGTTTYGYVSPYDIANCQEDQWRSGLLLSQRTANSTGAVLEQTSYDWRYAQISNMPASLSSTCRSTVSRVPLQASKTITRDGKTFSSSYSYDSYGRVIATDESGDNGDSRRTERSYLTDTSRWIMDKVTAESVR